MRYLLLIYDEEKIFDAMSPEEVGECMAGYKAFSEDAEAAGVLRGSDRLRPVAMATTVRVRNGQTLTTDGPFAETKEQLGGYYMIEADDLDAAIAWAQKIPSATFGSIEVRPVWELGPEDH